MNTTSARTHSTPLEPVRRWYWPENSNGETLTGFAHATPQALSHRVCRADRRLFDHQGTIRTERRPDPGTRLRGLPAQRSRHRGGRFGAAARSKRDPAGAGYAGAFHTRGFFTAGIPWATS